MKRAHKSMDLYSTGAGLWCVCVRVCNSILVVSRFLGNGLTARVRTAGGTAVAKHDRQEAERRLNGHTHTHTCTCGAQKAWNERRRSISETICRTNVPHSNAVFYGNGNHN